MNKKLKEVQEILNKHVSINKENIIKDIIKKYKTELNGFTYTENIEEILCFKNKYIKYVSVSGILYYGGIYYKSEIINNKLYIYLINQNKKPWIIEFDKYYIFYNNRIKNDNDYKRNVFNLFLKELN
jgi:hypothetical protein